MLVPPGHLWATPCGFVRLPHGIAFESTGPRSSAKPELIACQVLVMVIYNLFETVAQPMGGPPCRNPEQTHPEAHRNQNLETRVPSKPHYLKGGVLLLADEWLW